MLFNEIKIKDVKVKSGQLVKILRKNAKLSQEELAEQLNLSRLTIQHLESGKNFTIDTFLKVMRHFDLLGDIFKILDDKIDEQDNLISLY
jgi:transcriptional regulator with XRE-family HTH domain